MWQLKLKAKCSYTKLSNANTNAALWLLVY